MSNSLLNKDSDVLGGVIKPVFTESKPQDFLSMVSSLSTFSFPVPLDIAPIITVDEREMIFFWDQYIVLSYQCYNPKT